MRDSRARDALARGLVPARWRVEELDEPAMSKPVPARMLAPREDGPLVEVCAEGRDLANPARDDAPGVSAAKPSIELAPRRASVVTAEADGAAPPARDRASTAPVPPEPRTATADSWRSLARGVVQVAASHGVVALVGLASLPVLVRNLGAAQFGAFSLFLTLLGCIAYQDFLRPLLIRERAVERTPEERADLDALSRVLPFALAPLALVLAWPFCGALAASVLSGCVLLHVLASPDYARLALDGRAAFASTVRNLAWASATGIACAASFAATSPLVWLTPFLAANAAIALVFARAHGRGELARTFERPPREPRSLATDLSGARRAFARHRGAIGDLLGFNAAAAITACADRALLVLCVPAAAFGAYTAAVELAFKLDLAGSTLAALLQPALTRRLQREPDEEVAASFVRVGGIVLAGLACVVAATIALSGPLVALVLGPELAGSRSMFAFALVGTFVHMLGFLITPWQRARGDFASPRRAYYVSAACAVGVGLVAIPICGAQGALWALLASRAGDVVLVAGEARRLPASVLPRWKLALLAGITTALVALAFVAGG